MCIDPCPSPTRQTQPTKEPQLSTDEKRQAVSDKLDGIKLAIKGIFAAHDAERAMNVAHIIKAHLDDIDSLMEGIKADTRDMVVPDAAQLQQTDVGA